MIVTILAILGSLGIFLFGMRVMSESLQRLSGERLRGIMRAMTSTRGSAIGTGLLVTCLVQSSSASTVMIVGFVNAGLLKLTESIGMILGANLGTTTTFWIISFLGFKFSIFSVALPIVGIGFPLLFFKRQKIRDTGEFLVGFGLLFIGLFMLRDSVPNVKDHPEMFAFIQNFTNRGMVSVMFFFAFGTVLTILVQSSSVAGAITLTMANLGWIDYPSAAAIILGENVGTTITANLAALAGNANAKRAGLAHFLFNIIGVIWAIALFAPFTRLVDFMVPLDANDPANLPIHMAAFHTLFNFINIALVVGFVPQLARLVERIIPDGTRGADHVTYTTGAIPHTGELSIAEAESDVRLLGEHTRKLLDGFVQLFSTPGPEPEKRVAELKKVEEDSDRLATNVTDYLLKLSSGNLSESTLSRIGPMLRVVAELEDMCDCGYRLVRLAGRKSRKNRQLPPETEQEVRQFAELLNRFMDFWTACLDRPVTAADMETAFQLEALIDESRKRLRKESTRRMQLGGDAIKAERLYIDALNNMARIGSHTLNILQALRHRA
jgi:phosphate:Na+ symporter